MVSLDKWEIALIFLSGYFLNWLNEGAFILGQYLKNKYDLFGFKEAKEEYKKKKNASDI